MRALACLALVLVAGCFQPSPKDVSFASVLGEPGCSLRLPDGGDACGSEEPLAVEAAPPPGWTCINEGDGPGFRYAVYRELATGDSGVQFGDRNFGDTPSGLILDSTRPDFIGHWNGTYLGFVDLGSAVGQFDNVSVFVYTFRIVRSEGEAALAAVRERWSVHDGYPWLSYEVTVGGQAYTLSGMSSSGHPVDLDVSNGAGRLQTRLDWNGGWAVGGGDIPSCA